MCRFNFIARNSRLAGLMEPEEPNLPKLLIGAEKKYDRHNDLENQKCN
jgi:hypothetical protein